jgi:hypothetical protein
MEVFHLAGEKVRQAGSAIAILASRADLDAMFLSEFKQVRIVGCPRVGFIREGEGNRHIDSH